MNSVCPKSGGSTVRMEEPSEVDVCELTVCELTEYSRSIFYMSRYKFYTKSIDIVAVMPRDPSVYIFEERSSY